MIALQCKCVVLRKEIEEFVQSVDVKTLNCPKCKTPISSSILFLKEDIQQKYESVQSVADKFFSLNLKLSERRKTLADSEWLSYQTIMNKTNKEMKRVT